MRPPASAPTFGKAGPVEPGLVMPLAGALESSRGGARSRMTQTSLMTLNSATKKTRKTRKTKMAARPTEPSAPTDSPVVRSADRAGPDR